jgi:hypothetical protein
MNHLETYSVTCEEDCQYKELRGLPANEKKLVVDAIEISQNRSKVATRF